MSLLPPKMISETQGTSNKVIDPQAMKKAEKELVEILTRIGIINPDYQGEVILHFSQGGLSEIDRFEKSIRRRFEKNLK